MTTFFDWLSQLFTWLTQQDEFTKFYAANLRASLFSGFLTLSGFLFAVKTFLVVRLQADVYSNIEYQDWILNVGKTFNADLTIYGPLRRLGRLLFSTLMLTVAAALSQLSIGLVGQRWSTLFSLGLAVVAITWFIRTLRVVRSAICDWMDFLEDQAKTKAEERAAASKPT